MATSSVKDVSLNFGGITALDGISYGVAVALVILLLVLVVRPSGLLGTRETARV